MYSHRNRNIAIKTVCILFSVVAIYFLAACGKPTGNPENGPRWYSLNNCDSCHGERGTNGMAPAIAGTEIGFGSFMKNLRKPDSVSKPVYSETDISRQDAADMYAWLKRNPQENSR